MTVKDNDHASDALATRFTAMLRANALAHGDISAAGIEGAVSARGDTPKVAGLLLVRGPDTGSRFPLDQPVSTVGRHRDSDIFLDDVTVSRKHAEFRCGDGQCRIVDLGSLNGTYVNGKPVESAILTIGDLLEIGKFRLVYLTAPTTDISQDS
jgi:pSer/pThr/pTyr-binding forkhead associated (FHA) protein